MKKKKTVKVRRRFEKEINRRFCGGEHREEVEEELELEDPMELGDDIGSFEDEGDKGATVTLVEHRMPTTAPIGGRRGTKMCGDTPESRKDAAGEDATREWEAKRAWSPWPSEASFASCPLL